LLGVPKSLLGVPKMFLGVPKMFFMFHIEINNLVLIYLKFHNYEWR
jgi:hypothetical protein